MPSFFSFKRKVKLYKMFLIVENWQCWNSNLDSSLGNGDCLLFHSLMDSHLILGVHFVKFVYTTHSIVRQHKGTCFNHKLVRFFILNHSSCQTCSRTGLSTGVHSSWTELFNLEKFIETMKFQTHAPVVPRNFIRMVALLNIEWKDVLFVYICFLPVSGTDS